MDNIRLFTDDKNLYPILSEEEKGEIKRILDRHIENRERLILKSLAEIENLECVKFYIASYQRGYRWGKDEVEALLDDIYLLFMSKSENDYCMQPLVVKCVVNKETAMKLSDNEDTTYNLAQCYELIDGQQRLTTLYLIMNELSELPGMQSYKPKYEIFYEISRGIDKDFINNAKSIIQNWVIEKFYTKKRGKEPVLNEDKLPKIKNICDTIKNKLKFIWNEISKDSEDIPEKTFRKINKGKIPLTNAELFKAMLLNCPDSASEEQKQGVEKIAFEWDKIEQELRNDDFWYFVSNDISDKRTRIDYVLDVYASGLDEAGYYDINKDRYSFLVVSKHLEKIRPNSNVGEWETKREVWKDIVKLYDKMLSWYKDNDLYHHIGFLVACRGKRRSTIDLIKELNKTLFSTKQDIRNYVKKKCAEILIPTFDKKEIAFEYFDYNNTETDNNDIRNFLLYSNIYEYWKYGITENKPNELSYNEFRFPFHMYKKTSWDIEHINPQTPEVDWKKTITTNDKEEQDQEKQTIIHWLNMKIKLENDKMDSLTLDSEDKLITEAWNKYRPKNPGTGVISNLVLLNSSINRAYQNALFFQKRSKIIENDKAGVFILPVVKNVFLKYFTNSPDDLIEWTEGDQTAYGESLRDIFKEIKGWKEYDSKSN